MIPDTFREEVMDLVRKHDVKNVTIQIGEQFIDFQEEEN